MIPKERSRDRDRLKSAFRKGVKEGRRLEREASADLQRRIDRLEFAVSVLAGDFTVIHGNGATTPIDVASTAKDAAHE